MLDSVPMTKTAKAAKETGKIYEVGYHLVSSIAEEQVPATVAEIKKYLAEEKAVVISEENPMLRPLAYSIKKAFGGAYKTFTEAYFGFIKFELGEEGAVGNIDAKLKANPQVLRHIVVKTVREETMYSPKMGTFADEKAKPVKVTEKKADKPASIAEIDESIEKFVKEEVGA